MSSGEGRGEAGSVVADLLIAGLWLGVIGAVIAGVWAGSPNGSTSGKWFVTSGILFVAMVVTVVVAVLGDG